MGRWVTLNRAGSYIQFFGNYSGLLRQQVSGRRGLPLRA